MNLLVPSEGSIESAHLRTTDVLTRRFGASVKMGQSHTHKTCQASDVGEAWRDSQRRRRERRRLSLCLRCDGLVDLPQVAFGVGKVCRAQPPALVGWGSDKRNPLRFEFLVGG